MSSGKYLLFIDADVNLEKGVVLSAYKEVKELNLGLLSVFPAQQMKSLGEWLVVPLMNWLLLTFLPLHSVYYKKSHSLAAANGQFMFFSRPAYESAGGHYSINSSIVEDMVFARKLKQKNITVKTFLGGDLVFCRMYNDFNSSITGFSKNFYPGFGLNPIAFLTILLFLTFSFSFPIILVFIDKIFILPLILIIMQRILISVKSGQHVVINLLLHPLQIIMLFFLGINSVIVSKKKKRQWKGRTF
jgi:chlorobactene glucosyltransferase